MKVENNDDEIGCGPAHYLRRVKSKKAQDTTQEREVAIEIIATKIEANKFKIVIMCTILMSIDTRTEAWEVFFTVN